MSDPATLGLGEALAFPLGFLAGLTIGTAVIFVFGAFRHGR